MPADDEKAQIARIDRLIATAKGSWFALLSYLAFVGVTLMGVEDADFFIPSRQTELPIIGVSVPTALFFYVAPGLGAAVYAYFHLHLLKLWEQLSLAPAQVDNVPLSDNIAPWLIADYALVQRPDGALRNRPLGRLAHYVVGGLAFWAAPLVLAAFWFRSMPKHDPWLTGLAIGIPLLLAIYVGKRSHEQLVSLMKPDATIRMVSNVAWSIVAFVTLLFGQLSSYGIYDEDPRMHALHKWAEWPVSANLAGVAFTETPKGWEDFDVARDTYRRTWCKERGVSSLACGEVDHSGSVLSDDLQYFRDMWCKEALAPSRNCRDYFKATDREFADAWSVRRSSSLATAIKLDLSKTDLRRANLWRARLEGANLWRAQLEGANLREAQLEGADLRQAQLEGAFLSRARLEGARLSEAQLDGATLDNTQLDGADLSFTQLKGAHLFQARLEGANLAGAQLEEANLEGAQLRGADLWRAQLRGAALRDVDYTSVAWEQSQIDDVYGDESVTLPPSLTRPAHWPDWEMVDWAFKDEWHKWKADPASYIPPEKPS